MKTYLVGGAVRDKLLGVESNDLDYVVVGATPKIMLDAGYEQVGASFPVFIHPITQCEYALARTERKVGAGYLGFEVDASWTVTLEEDLRRRDLTINSMAIDEDGNLIDPFDGHYDLMTKVLRHTSEAFIEDPVRILRLARFYSKLKDFTIDDETAKLCRSNVHTLEEIPVSRFWREIEKVVIESDPVQLRRFVEALDNLGVLMWSSFFKDALPNMLLGYEEIYNVPYVLDNMNVFSAAFSNKKTKTFYSHNAKKLSKALFMDLNDGKDLYKVIETIGGINTVLVDSLYSAMCSKHRIDSAYKIRYAVPLMKCVSSTMFTDTGPALGKAIGNYQLKLLNALFK